jgi:hypothetical protein
MKGGAVNPRSVLRRPPTQPSHTWVRREAASRSGGVANKSGIVTGGQNSDLAVDRNDVGNVAERPSAPATVHKGHAAKGRADEAGIGSGPKVARSVGKSAGEALGIDLVRPDDGYANAGLARRAARSSLIPTSQKKRLQILPPVPVTPHLRSPAGTSFEPLRNSAGAEPPRIGP